MRNEDDEGFRRWEMRKGVSDDDNEGASMSTTKMCRMEVSIEAFLLSTGEGQACLQKMVRGDDGMDWDDKQIQENGTK